MRKSIKQGAEITGLIMLGAGALLVGCGGAADAEPELASSSESVGGSQLLLSTHVTFKGVGVPGVMLTVKDASQRVIARATTDNYGDHTFNVARGYYTVSVAKSNARFSPAAVGGKIAANESRAFVCTSGCAVP